MTYKELKEKEAKLAKELLEVREELAIKSREEVTALISTAIDSLKKANELCATNLSGYIDVYCEDCEAEFDYSVNLEDIINCLKDLI